MACTGHTLSNGTAELVGAAVEDEVVTSRGVGDVVAKVAVPAAHQRKEQHIDQGRMVMNYWALPHVCNLHICTRRRAPRVGVGASVCAVMGGPVGAFVGAAVGGSVGALVGEMVGALVGGSVGASVGAAVGALVGGSVGALVGAAVGALVGGSLGAAVGALVGGLSGVGVAGGSEGVVPSAHLPACGAIRKLTVNEQLLIVDTAAQSKHEWVSSQHPCDRRQSESKPST